MAIQDLVGVLSFGILATGATMAPHLVGPWVVGSFVLSFFIRWLFEKSWNIILTFRMAGFYFICFVAGIFITIGFAIGSSSSLNLWLAIHSIFWIILALLLIRNFAERVSYYGN